ncbi:MAG TPA: extracellular solute-binding protein [Firmicutes bacterium]|nr:extracellular solute-binding protein [Bacillota bacterium]
MRLQQHRVSTVLVFTLVFLLSTSASTFAAQPTVKITLWHHWAPELIGEVIAGFQLRYPWIEVEHITSDYSKAVDRMAVLLATGAAPEVMMVNSAYAYQFMSLGSFLLLDDLLTRDNIQLSMFNPGDLRGFQVRDKTYGLPCMSGSAWTNLMFYNKDLMNNVGLDADRPPRTWSEWQTAARRIMRVDGSGKVIQGSQIPRLSNIAAWNGSQFWDEQWRTATVSNPRTMEAITFTSELISSTYGSLTAHDQFHRGGLSFWEGTSGIIFPNNSGFGAAQKVEFSWGAALAPVNEENPDSRPINIVTSTWAYGIPATIAKDKQEAAWLLLLWLTTHEDGGGYFARAQGRPSPVIRFNGHPDYRKNPYWNVVIDALQYDMPTPPVDPVTIINDAGMQILNNKVHPQQALATADQKLQFALDEYWKVLDR